MEAGTLRGAALLAGGAKGLWRSHYNWLDADKEYAESFERAKAMVADYAEDSVYERAFEGYDRQLTYKGRKTGDVIKERSDLLSIFWLKGAKPQKYRDNAITIVNAPKTFAFVLERTDTAEVVDVGQAETLAVLPEPQD